MRQTWPLFPHRCMRDQTYLLKTLFKVLTSKLKHDKKHWSKGWKCQGVKEISRVHYLPRATTKLHGPSHITGRRASHYKMFHFFLNIYFLIYRILYLNRAITRSRRNKCHFAPKFPQIITNCIWYKNNGFCKNPVQYFQNIFYKSYNLLFLPREMSLCDFNAFTPQGTELCTS